MTDEVERGGHSGPVRRGTGPSAPRRDSRLYGPENPPDDHDHRHANGHFALIYERRDDQFAAAMPFIREGLERGERCLYVADDNAEEAVLAAMREYGIDVDAARASGALAVLTPPETYFRTGEFDRAAMLEFWEETLEEATEAGGYAGLRAAAEMSWALDTDTSLAELVEYEAALNSLYEGEDYLVMCQYDRERFPATVLHGVIETHPYIVADGTVSRNDYYTPPEQFSGGGTMASRVDGLLQTLHERTEAEAALRERQEYLERVFESSHDAILVIDPEAAEVLDANPAAAEMLGYSRDELLTLDPTALLPPDGREPFDDLVEGVVADGRGRTAELTCRTDGGRRVPVEFAASPMRYHGRAVVLAVVRDLSEHRERDRAQRRLSEITADPDRPFDDKLQAVLDLGCEYFDLELGGLARIRPEADRLEVETISGEHDHLVPSEAYPLSETFDRLIVGGGTVGVTDPVDRGFAGDRCYEQFGVRAYLGTGLELEAGDDRTLFFVSEQPRDTAFSDAERTFLDLMGQWVTYELERRQREQALRERTAHLSTLVETAPDCIKTVAPDGTLLQMNPAGLALGGADAEADVVGECVYDFVAPEHRERYRAFNERICDGERGTLEFDIIGLDGDRRHVKSHAAPLARPDGTTVQVAVTRDITEQIERERELERALDLLEKAQRIADVGGWEIDADTEAVYWTDQVFELLDVDAEAEPELDEALAMYHEADQQAVRTAVEDALETGEPFDIEARIRTDSGEVRWLQLQGVPETAADGDEVASLRGVAQDVTARKERERRLEAAIDRLEASNERLEQFAYAASHDLQEPLRMVSSYLGLIEDRYADALDEDGEEFLEFAVDGADRMRAMIEGLLSYSRVETEGEPLEPVELGAVVEAVVSDLQLQIEESDAEITVDELPRVAGDASQLRQVIQNLLENAITYSGDEPPRIHVSADRHGDEWVVSVRDEGIGIDPENADRVFGMFQRLHSRDEHAGTGIGLALCERIVERHGGDIWVEAEPGEGSTFAFTVPAAEAHPSAAAVQPGPGAHRESGETD